MRQEIPDGADWVLLLMRVPKPRSTREYRAYVLDKKQEPKEAAVILDLNRSPELGFVTFLVSLDLWTPGQYRVDLWGLADSQTYYVQSYRFKVPVMRESHGRSSL